MHLLHLNRPMHVPGNIYQTTFVEYTVVYLNLYVTSNCSLHFEKSYTGTIVLNLFAFNVESCCEFLTKKVFIDGIDDIL